MNMSLSAREKEIDPAVRLNVLEKVPRGFFRLLKKSIERLRFDTIHILTVWCHDNLIGWKVCETGNYQPTVI